YLFNSQSNYRISRIDQQNIFYFQSEVLFKLNNFLQNRNDSFDNEDALRKKLTISEEGILEYKIPENSYEILAELKTKDKKRNLLESLYGFKITISKSDHLNILKNILKQIKTRPNEFGQAIDIDTLVLVKNVPLVCRNLVDLEVILHNQLFIYEHARELIIQLFGLKNSATYENDPLLRQIIADYESKIKTSFRNKGIRLNLIMNLKEEIDLNIQSCEEVTKIIEIPLDLKNKRGIPTGTNHYNLSHIDQDFFPSGGYNIL
ncbi:hypothetical protein D4S03_11680, partial [bacterium]